MGQARARAGDLSGARDAFAQAARLAPSDAAIAANHSLSLLRVGEAEAALVEARRAAALDPTLAAAQANQAHALLELGRSEEAVQCLSVLVGRDPNFADAWLGIALALRDQGTLGAALAASDRSVLLAPSSSATLCNQGLLRLEAGDPSAAVESFVAAAALDPEILSNASNALSAMIYDPTLSAEASAAAAAQWGAGLERSTPKRGSSRVSTGRPRRVGVVSADLRRHPVGWLGAQALMELDRSRWVVIAYDTGSPRDSLNARFRAALTWRDAALWSDSALAEQVVADGVDLLIDLAGHTAGGRPRLFAHKPTPRQAAWLGYPATTGLTAFDAVLLDAWHAPPGTERLFTEPVKRLEGGRFAYTPPIEAPRPERKPGPPTFASFHALAKLNDRVARLWADVLHAIPGSRLLIKRAGLGEPWLQNRMMDLFARNGLDPARLDLEPASDYRQLLETYGRVDVCLDSFPFCGGVTTAESLWMGVPVVTLEQPSVAGRQSLAMLSAIGREDLIAENEREYATAVEAALGQTPDRLRLREQVSNSPLGSAIRLARSLEIAFDEICETQGH